MALSIVELKTGNGLLLEMRVLPRNNTTALHKSLMSDRYHIILAGVGPEYVSMNELESHCLTFHDHAHSNTVVIVIDTNVWNNMNYAHYNATADQQSLVL